MDWGNALHGTSIMNEGPEFPQKPLSCVSVIIPVYLNEATLEELAERLVKTLKPLAGHFELVLVNDASPDGSAAVLVRLQGRFPQLKAVNLGANGGQQNAIRVGMHLAKYDTVVVMDADLQDPPEAIADLYKALQSGNSEAVFAQRTEHYQEFSRMLSSRFFKWLIRMMVGLPRGTGCFLIMSRRMVTGVLSFETRRFYLPGLVAKTGLPICAIPLQRVQRASGQSAYSSTMRLGVAISNIRCLLERK